MADRAGWTEEEVRAAVSAYFKLLKDEQDGRVLNKAKVYRALSERFPNRPPKAFELKFQNISAVLYEQKLPYCSGLKPRSNYQRLLRLLVLDHLDKSPLPRVEPQEILFAKLRELSARGAIPVTRRGTGRYGLAIEELLGIRQNSDKAADFMGIELKTKSDGSLQTLFSLVPTRFIEDTDKQSMFRRHCYQDKKRSRRALYTSFSSKPDSLGFRLSANSSVISIFRGNVPVLAYDTEAIEEALLSKHTQTAFLLLGRGGGEGVQTCTLEGVQFCKWPSIIRFIRLVSSGQVFLDFTMSEGQSGRIKDHGFLWRIRGASVDKLYLSSRALDLAG